MNRGRLKKMFPGGNTSKGFYSFYNYIIEQKDAAKIFVIKGGPGVGKSTFMRKIAEAMLDRGYDVEFHYCSSDTNSLDGIVIPDIGVAMLDGTAPHVVDPKHPGAIDEIIHLGDHWNETGLRGFKDEILEINQEVGRCFKRAYECLAAAKIYQNQVESFYRESGALKTGELDKLSLELSHIIFEGRDRQTLSPKARHLFATAHTPIGPVSFIDNIVERIGKRYIIVGDDGTGTTTIVARLFESAMMRGFNVEAYHCALSPDLVEHLVIPGLDTAVIISVEPHFFKPRETDTVIDTMQFVEPIVKENERNEAREMYRRSMEMAYSFIAKAKQAHDMMETFYIPFMNFNEIDTRRDKVLARILELADTV